MWRTGANKATKITFNENCVFGGAKVKKGSYSLFTIPGEKEWTVVLNKNTELWGVGEYDEKNQVCSIVSKAIETKDFTESFTIDFGTFQSFSAIMSLKWANTKIDIKIESLAAKKLEKQYQLKKPQYSKISFRHANPVGYTNQTYLYDLEEYLILDVGIHLYDLSRFFLGEATSVYTINQNTNKKFKGETAFTSLVRHENGGVSIIDASISSIKTPDRFAQTLVNVEYANGSIDLDYDYNITVHKKGLKKTHKANPKKLKWISRPWNQIQESIVNTHNHFISYLNKKRIHDTSGADNIKSLSLVFASYQSNKHRKEIQLNEK